MKTKYLYAPCRPLPTLCTSLYPDFSSLIKFQPSALQNHENKLAKSICYKENLAKYVYVYIVEVVNFSIIGLSTEAMGTPNSII